MADNLSITQGTGTVVAADQLPDGSYVQYVKLMDGTADGTAKGIIGVNGLKVDPSAVTQPISVISLPLPSGAATLAGQQAAQATFGSITANKMVLYDATGAAVDYTAASPVSQSGTWTVQIGNTPNTTAIKVDGSAVTQPVSLPGTSAMNPPHSDLVSGAITTAMTGTTSTSLVAAPGASLRNYITAITVSNSHATVGTDVIIQDGSGGTTLYTIPAAAVYGGATITFPTPLKQPTANTAIYCANVTTGASTKVSAVGYKAA